MIKKLEDIEFFFEFRGIFVVDIVKFIKRKMQEILCDVLLIIDVLFELIKSL